VQHKQGTAQLAVRHACAHVQHTRHTQARQPPRAACAPVEHAQEVDGAVAHAGIGRPQVLLGAIQQHLQMHEQRRHAQMEGDSAPHEPTVGFCSTGEWDKRS